jgi:hypothetical protein
MVGHLSSLSKTVLLCSITISMSGVVFSQSNLTASNFEAEILNYQPVKSSSISEKDFDFASMVIRETKQVADDDLEGFNIADYFNVLTAFLSLKESDENIQSAFEKFSQSEGACEYFTSFVEEINEKKTYAPIRDQFNARAAECEKSAKPKENFFLEQYCSEHSLNSDLVALIEELDIKDRKYREDDYDNHIADQKGLDIENQFTIDSLFEVHGAYIGESQVGPKFESTMWAVVQHSIPEMMKKYLLVLKKAVALDELGEAAFKMTIDRYYALTYGYQVFGSQSGMGLDIADTEKRNEIAKLYGIKN